MNIPIYKPDLSGNELEYVTDAIQSGWVSSKGKYVEAFEETFADYCDVRHAVTVTSGTVSLFLSMKALGIKEGDEVIVPALTFVATASAVLHVGAIPVFADVHPQTWTIRTDEILQNITPRTKAIIPVHLYGHVADMESLLDIARENNLFVIEDAAEAHGASYKELKAGSMGDVGCFSFYGNKVITTGEGGMITTNNDYIAEQARYLKSDAMDKPYWHSRVGYNFCMTNMQAAIGLAQLERIDDILERKKCVAQYYKDRLGEYQVTAPWADNVHWMYSVVIDERKAQRGEVIDILSQKGIETRPVFYPIPIMPPYKKYARGDYPISRYVANRGINLPSHPGLTEEELEYICDCVERFL